MKCFHLAPSFTGFMYTRPWKGSYFGVRENPCPFSWNVTIPCVYIYKLEMGMGRKKYKGTNPCVKLSVKKQRSEFKPQLEGPWTSDFCLNVLNENIVQPFRSVVLKLIRTIWMVCYNRFAGSHLSIGFPGDTVVKNLPVNAGDGRDTSSIPGLGRSPGGDRQPTPLFLLRKSHGQRSLAGLGLPRVGTQLSTYTHPTTPVYRVAESDMTEATKHVPMHMLDIGLSWSLRTCIFDEVPDDTDAGMGSTQSISSVVENCPSTRETRFTRLTGTELPHPGYSTNSPPSLPDLILHQEHMQPSVLLRSLCVTNQQVLIS